MANYKNKVAYQRTSTSKLHLICVLSIPRKSSWGVKKAILIYRKRRINFALFILLLLPLSLQAQQLQSFCLNQNVSLTEARSYVRDILMPQDKVGLRESMHCLEIVLDDARTELVEKYLKRRYGYVASSGVTANRSNDIPVARGECQMELKEISSLARDKTTIAVGAANVLRQSSKNNEQVTNSSLRLGQGLWGKLQIDDQYIEIRCQQRGLVWQVDVRFMSNNSQLMTSLSMATGQEVDLGQTVQDLKKNNQSASTSSGVRVHKVEGKKTKRYLLTIR